MAGGQEGSREWLALRAYMRRRTRWRGRPLYMALVAAAQSNGLPVATVVPALAGYGGRRALPHRLLAELICGGAVVVEIVGPAERVAAVLDAARPALGRCLALLRRVEPVLIAFGRDEGRRR